LARLAFDSPTRRPTGLSAAVEIYGPERQAAVLVPADALVTEGTATSVFIIEGNNDAQKKAHRVAVEVGLVAGGLAEILSGVKAGEAVVVRGQTALPDGATVEISEAGSGEKPEPEK
jgi:hypothetical protein